jgi:hypothetical protein
MMELNTIIKAGRLGSNTVTEEDLKAINSFALKELTADDVFTFKIKAADNSTDDRNLEPFTLNALRQLKKLYVGRTVGKDHKVSADVQCARIYATDLTESKKTNGVNGEKVYDLVCKCYMARTAENAGLISEIEAGIKREVSTSCRVSKALCSICGTDLTKKYCRHLPGETYNGKICYRVLDEVKDAYELSFVAVPAQPQAGTFKGLASKNEKLPAEDKKTSEKEAVCAQCKLAYAIAQAEIFMMTESEEKDHE